MQIHGFPTKAKLPEELGFGERFWYWQGSSGRNYIHSIYGSDQFPPSPGAVYVAVRRRGSIRQAVAVGRFPNFWDSGTGATVEAKHRGIVFDEIHVHLLARNNEAAEAVLDDLSLALHGEEHFLRRYGGFSEAALSQLSAA